MNVKRKYYLWSTILITVFFSVWSLFYFYLDQLVQKNTQSQLNGIAKQIMKDLGDEFYNLEQITFTLSQSKTVKDFVSEKDVKVYFYKADDINEMLTGGISNLGLIGSVIVFNQDGTYYRFRGNQGNTACQRIFYLIHDKASPEHMIVKANGTRLIGYGSGIYDQLEQRIGSIVVLLDEEAVLSRLLNYNQPNTVHIFVAAKDEIIIAEKPDLLGLNKAEVSRGAYYFAEEYIGITPFSILVTADSDYLKDSKTYFTAAVAATGLALGIALLIFGFAIRKYFFNPLLKVLSSVENLDLNLAPGSLSYVDSEEFDKLVGKLNEMLKKIDAKNKGIQHAMLLVKNTEIEKHKAVIHSLKKQINAHFTVNILNIIRILVTKRELEQAAALCDELSMLVRYAHDEDEFINAWDEFYVLQNYINIMNIRYNNKFKVNFDLDDRLMDLKMPRMLLQPVIENSVVHGYRNFKQECLIDIAAQVKEGRIIIRVRDEGEGISEARYEKIRRRLGDSFDAFDSVGGIENIALVNINRRIGYYYGEGFGLSMRPSKPHGLEVLITLGIDPLNSSRVDSDKEKII